MKILVFGKSGQVATALQERAGTFGIDAVALSRSECDVTQPDQIRTAVDEVLPDVLVNASAFTAVDLAEEEIGAAHELNEKAVGHLGEISRAAGLPIIHVSTDYVFDGEKPGAYLETDPTNPQSVYGSSKLAGETVLRANNPDSVVLRTAWVFSHTGSNFLKTMIRLGKERDELTIVADQFGNPTSAEEIANAILSVCRKIESNGIASVAGIYHFCGPEKMSWAEFASRIFSLSSELGERTIMVKHISSDEYPTAAKRPANSSLNSDKFQSVFSYAHEDTDLCIGNVLSRLDQPG